MNKNLLIVFVKNIKLGKVKTRLAKTIGNDAAFEVYKHLVLITQKESQKLTNVDRHIYFSDVIIDTKWPRDEKFVQDGENLGDRMKDAFQRGFDKGYNQVVGIGSDLASLTSDRIQEAFDQLETNETVFGPAEDGGYYIFGMRKYFPFIFENKPWSKENLFDTTIKELESKEISFGLLKIENDIDTIEDLKTSCISEKFKHLYDLP